MAETGTGKSDDETERHFQHQIACKAERKMQAMREEDRGVVFWLGMFGLVGWSITLPTLAGIALGIWIDNTWPSRMSWTLTLLFIGITTGCFQAWHWIKEERNHD